jgi:hypothetical protein
MYRIWFHHGGNIDELFCLSAAELTDVISPTLKVDSVKKRMNDPQP